MELQEEYRVSGPQLAVLGEVETKLPAPAKKRPTALAVLAAAILAATLGLGGFKLKGQYQQAAELYYTENDGYSIGYLVEQSRNYGANMARVAAQVLGESDPLVQEVSGLVEQLGQTDLPAEQYLLESRLVADLKALYELTAPELSGSQYDSFRGQYQEALSAFEQSGHMQYNIVAGDYNKIARGFPANLMAGLWGAEEVSLYQ